MANEVRLIDANALIRDHGDDVTNWDRPYAVKISSIEAAPTIDPESLRPKGRWENVQETVMYVPEMKYTTTHTAETCSACKARVGFVGQKVYLHDQICPSCGAKMEG